MFDLRNAYGKIVWRIKKMPAHFGMRLRGQFYELSFGMWFGF